MVPCFLFQRFGFSIPAFQRCVFSVPALPAFLVFCSGVPGSVPAFYAPAFHVPRFSATRCEAVAVGCSEDMLFTCSKSCLNPPRQNPRQERLKAAFHFCVFHTHVYVRKTLRPVSNVEFCMHRMQFKQCIMRKPI